MEINQQLLWSPAPSGSRSGEAPGGSWGPGRPGSTNDISLLAKSPNGQWPPRWLPMHRGVRVLDASSGEGKVRGRGFMTQLKSSLPQSIPGLLQPTRTPFFSVPLQHLQSFIHILYSAWNSVCHLHAGRLEAQCSAKLPGGNSRQPS